MPPPSRFPEDKRHSSFFIVAICFAAIAVVLGAVLVARYRWFIAPPAASVPVAGQQHISPAGLAVNHANSLNMRGMFDDAERISRQLLSEIENDNPNYPIALGSLATAEFWSAEKQKRIDAVRITKDQIVHYPGSAYNQALLINRLIGYATTAMEPFIIDAIFDGEPFQSLRVPDDELGSLKNLAEESIRRRPTNSGYFKVGIWHSSHITKHHDGIAPLSKVELAADVDAIVGILATTTAAFASEEETIEGRPFWKLQAPAFHYFQGFLYGSLALVDSRYLADSEASFRTVIDLYEHDRDVDGSGYALIANRLPYVYFSLATYTDAVAGSSRAGDVRDYLQHIIDIVHADPSVHAGAFVAFMKQTRADGRTGTAGRWYSYDRFVRMAQLHQPFKDFLDENGWNLQ